MKSIFNDRKARSLTQNSLVCLFVCLVGQPFCKAVNPGALQPQLIQTSQRLRWGSTAMCWESNLSTKFETELEERELLQMIHRRQLKFLGHSVRKQTWKSWASQVSSKENELTAGKCPQPLQSWSHQWDLTDCKEQKLVERTGSSSNTESVMALRKMIQIPCCEKTSKNINLHVK